MDQTLADTLIANLKSAQTEEETRKAQTRSLIALVDCQRKTSDRVKDLHATRDRFLWLGRIVGGFATGGGFACFAKLLKSMGLM